MRLSIIALFGVVLGLASCGQYEKANTGPNVSWSPNLISAASSECLNDVQAQNPTVNQATISSICGCALSQLQGTMTASQFLSGGDQTTAQYNDMIIGCGPQFGATISMSPALLQIKKLSSAVARIPQSEPKLTPAEQAILKKLHGANKKTKIDDKTPLPVYTKVLEGKDWVAKNDVPTVTYSLGNPSPTTGLSTLSVTFTWPGTERRLNIVISNYDKAAHHDLSFDGSPKEGDKSDKSTATSVAVTYRDKDKVKYTLQNGPRKDEDLWSFDLVNLKIDPAGKLSAEIKELKMFNKKKNAPVTISGRFECFQEGAVKVPAAPVIAPVTAPTEPAAAAPNNDEEPTD